MAILSVRFRTASVRSGAAKKAILSAGFTGRTASVRSGVKKAVGVRSGAVKRPTISVGLSAVNRDTRSARSRAVNTTPAKPGATAARVRKSY
jgi:hypothetical protein